jgi:hypothetical protein
MATLQNLRGRSLVPDLGIFTDKLSEVFDQIRQREEQQSALSQQQSDIAQIFGQQVPTSAEQAELAARSNASVAIGTGPSRARTQGPVALPFRQGSINSRLTSPAGQRLMLSNPAAFKQASDMLTAAADQRNAAQAQQQAQAIAESRAEVERQGKNAQFLLNQKDPETRQKAFGVVIGELQRQGLDTANITRIMASEPDIQRLQLKKIVNSADDFKSVMAPEKPQSPSGKLFADLNAGLITQDQFDAAKKSTQAQKIAVAAAGGTTINLGAGKGAQRLAVLAADEFVAATKGEATARENLAQSATLRDALSNPDLFTGTGGNVVQFFKSSAQALGFDVQGVADGEIVQNVASKIALSFKDDLPGPMSDSDRKFLENLPPNLTKSAEGNRRLLLLADLPNQWKIERARIFRDHLLPDGSISNAVFAAESDAAAQFATRRQEAITALRELSSQAAPRDITAGFKDIERMPTQEIDNLNFEALSVEELDRVVKRLKELGTN